MHRYIIVCLTAFEHEMYMHNCSSGHFNSISTFLLPVVVAFQRDNQVFVSVFFFWGGVGQGEGVAGQENTG